jgi:E3 ubiquitin-protein ligase BRE1
MLCTTNVKDHQINFTEVFVNFLEELASAVAELEESNRKLAVLKAQGDTTHGTPIFFPTLGNKNMPEDNFRDKQKELLDLEACHKEFKVSIEYLVS